KWKLRDRGYLEWLKDMRALIIDECSMVNDELLDSIVHLFKICKVNSLNNIHFIITGDFYQLPPASEDLCFLNKEWYDDRSKEILRESWRSLDLVYVGLTEIFRQEDPEFKHYCTNLRYGFFNEDTFRYFKKCNYTNDDGVRLFSQKKFRNEYNN